MEIHCEKCGIYLGEIRDANLRNRISYFCNVCTKKLKALDKKEPPVNPYPKRDFGEDNPLGELFNEFFGKDNGLFK